MTTTQPPQPTKKTQTRVNISQTPGHDFSKSQWAALDCAPGSQLAVVEIFVADPNAQARNDSDEICTQLNGRLYYAGEGPQPPMHYNCRCVREFFAYWCESVD